MMYIDFHTHGKLAKKLPFSGAYTDWLFREARRAGLDALCLTEHFNTLQFEEIYRYIQERADSDGDTLLFHGLRIFPGMETDIAEGGHILSIGPLDAILELNRRLSDHKEKENFLPFSQLMDVFTQYPVLVGAAHPFRSGGRIPELPLEQLERLDFLDFNGKDIACDREGTERKITSLGRLLNKPVAGGSDTHQAVQYGCVKTKIPTCATVRELGTRIERGEHEIIIHPEIELKVRTAGILKRALKEVHCLGGDYVSLLISGPAA